MATIPIENPGVPFLGYIPGGLAVGSMLRIKGQMNADGYRISINIQGGAALSPRDDVALHLSIRPSENCIVRNNFLYNEWGTEERLGGCPIRPGQHFDLLILAEHAAWKVLVKNQHFCLFKHRIAITTSQYISIDGDCGIDSISLEGDTSPQIPIPAFSHMTPHISSFFAGRPLPPLRYPRTHIAPMGPEPPQYHRAGHLPYPPATNRMCCYCSTAGTTSNPIMSPFQCHTGVSNCYIEQRDIQLRLLQEVAELTRVLRMVGSVTRPTNY